MEYIVEKKRQKLKIAQFYLLMTVLLAFLLYTHNISFIYIIITIILAILAIWNYLQYKYEKITFSESGFKYLNIFNSELECDYSCLKYITYKEHYTKSTSRTSSYSTKYGLRKRYTIYNDYKKVCTFEESEMPAGLDEFLNKIIKDDILKEKTETIDEKDGVLLKTKKFPVIFNCFMMLFSIIFIIVLVSMYVSVKDPSLLIMIIAFSIFIIYYIKLFLESLTQVIQKIYYIKKDGFYIVSFGNRKFYSFSEITSMKVKKYASVEPVDRIAWIYIDDKKILTITNETFGFYDLIDELKLERIIK